MSMFPSANFACRPAPNQHDRCEQALPPRDWRRQIDDHQNCNDSSRRRQSSNGSYGHGHGYGNGIGNDANCFPGDSSNNGHGNHGSGHSGGTHGHGQGAHGNNPVPVDPYGSLPHSIDPIDPRYQPRSPVENGHGRYNIHGGSQHGQHGSTWNSGSHDSPGKHRNGSHGSHNAHGSGHAGGSSGPNGPNGPSNPSGPSGSGGSSGPSSGSGTSVSSGGLKATSDGTAARVTTSGGFRISVSVGKAAGQGGVLDIVDPAGNVTQRTGEGSMTLADGTKLRFSSNKYGSDYLLHTLIVSEPGGPAITIDNIDGQRLVLSK